MSIPELAGHLKIYRAAWREAGHPGEADACLRIPLYAAPTEKEAVDEPRETITYYRRESQAQRLTALSYDDILATKVAFGTARALVDRLGALKDELGVSGIAVELNPGGLLTPDQEMRSLRILLNEVAPALA